MGTLSTKNRVVVVCGHYGSGKTNVAVNLAVDAAEKGDTVYLADVDIVNPYFRAADAVSMLEDAGVTVACLNLVKGLEFDAVAVVWPMKAERTPDEGRRLYTACTRALHKLAVYDCSEEEDA